MPKAIATVTSFAWILAPLFLTLAASSVAACALGTVAEGELSEDAGRQSTTDVVRGYTTARVDAGPARDVRIPTDAGRAAVDSGGPIAPADSGTTFEVTDAGYPEPDAGFPDPDAGKPPPPYDAGPVDPPPPAGTFCSDCSSDSDCGGGDNLCLTSFRTGLSFCGQDCSTTPCGADAQCVTVFTPRGLARQCVPISGTCPSP